MNTERAHAYGRIMRTLRASRGPGCVDDAVGRLREACVTLVFADAASPGDRAMTAAIVALADLVGHRCVSSELAAAIVDDLLRCASPVPATGRPLSA